VHNTNILDLHEIVLSRVRLIVYHVLFDCLQVLRHGLVHRRHSGCGRLGHSN